ncbi:MAG: aminotransferase class I/II-fold pyridoxal phosphate-dependent enzyme [Bacteroidetes bacterium]|nr:aminotransferase class I/II-fold pyridoxal phosphate-dependent enzyme [Bacteroidota bacterium]
MNSLTGPINTKLQHVGTSVFAVMAQVATEFNALNLSQGFPDFEVSGELIAKINTYMKKGYNQYAPLQGVPRLRENIAAKAKKEYGISYDPEKEINITAGATQAIYTAIASTIGKGDEVIIFEPAYDSYAPSVMLNGGTVKYAQLTCPDYRIDWEQLPGLISNSTRMIIINSPHNPTGSVLAKEDMQKLEKLVRNTNIIILSDEVYEHLIFDNIRHESICYYPELAARSFVIGSFGKTYHATGWKLGYVLAPEGLMKEFRKSHQFIVFTCNTPIQHAIADFLEDESTYKHLGQFYQQKRDYFSDRIKDSRFRILPSYGTYFQALDYSSISEEYDYDFAKRLTKEFGIASIPLSPFYNKNTDNKILRFCFAKKEETLDKAATILCKI